MDSCNQKKTINIGGELLDRQSSHLIVVVIPSFPPSTQVTHWWDCAMPRHVCVTAVNTDHSLPHPVIMPPQTRLSPLHSILHVPSLPLSAAPHPIIQMGCCSPKPSSSLPPFLDGAITTSGLGRLWGQLTNEDVGILDDLVRWLQQTASAGVAL